MAMLTILGILLLIWVACAVAGFVIKGLVWLAIIGIVLFVATAAWGMVQRTAHR
ncbi:hypothetical protein [Skermania sp. ID1734]|uniref:hypothetical protein n=1 Tax=Skermania sp. ID1734 TaxID=2597516 RepID=UPI00163DB0B8|nr:hypothetical protein [Skermania sp. ID1734]